MSELQTTRILTDFLQEFGEEMESCFDDAYNFMVQAIHDGIGDSKINDVIIRFIDEFGDDLDACNPEAFDFLYDYLRENNIEI